MKMAIEQISVGEATRIRKDPGDLTALQASIEKVGLLHPIVITPDRKLVAGFRRLSVARKLGWKEIEATVVSYEDDPLRLLDAEVEENMTRTGFTDEEIAAIVVRRKEIEDMLRGTFWQRVMRTMRRWWGKLMIALGRRPRPTIDGKLYN